MRVITNIAIRGFRSLDEVVLDDLGGLSVLVGPNNSGKSNVLRALNLFFSGRPQPNQALSFHVDHHNVPKSKKKKRISVDLTWDLEEISLKKPMQELLSPYGSRFTLRKEWTLASQLRPVMRVSIRKEGEPNFVPIDEGVVNQLLSLINFRYVPNRTVPAEELRQRADEIGRALSRRLARTGGDLPQDLLKKISDAASSVLHDVDVDLSRATEGLQHLEAFVPNELADLVLVGGFRAMSPLGTAVWDEAWGSGTQAYFMFLVLHAIDRDRSGSFGWRQGSVWAVEEPESSLHHDLAVRLADHLHGWSSGKERIQILSTTHSEVFTMRADSGYRVELKEGRSRISRMPIPLLASTAARSGVTAWPQPMLAFPYQPIVLVEGKIDSKVLAHAAKITGVGARFVFLSPSEMDPATGDGADNILSYLSKFGGLWDRRMPESPVLVLLDWDQNKRPIVKNLEKLFATDSSARIGVMDEGWASPRMTKQWKGIERFYRPEFVEGAETDGILSIGRDKDGRLLIVDSELKKAKSALAERMTASRDADNMQYFIKVLQDLEGRVAALVRGYYQHPLGIAD